MKTIINGVLLLLLSCSLAMAQSNYGNTTQTGDKNNAEINQAGTMNRAIINQDQMFGNGHIAIINQTTSEGNEGNFADVLQDQSSAEAYIDQTGSENMATTKQSGYNILTVTQEGSGNILGSYNDYASRAYQKNGTGTSSSDMNILTLTQNGTDNKTGLWQEHHAEATIDQAGAGNITRVYQSGTANVGEMNVAVVAENGNDNIAEIHQYGDNNSATAKLGHPNYTSDLNNATITQEGYGNTGSFGLLKGANNVISIDQTYGDNNYSEYSVKYGDDNHITAVDNGNDNRTRLGIDTDWGSMSSGNMIDVMKTGDRNYLSGVIDGSDNIINVDQTGNNNRIGTSWYTSDGINIQGNNNQLDITQMGDGNTSLNTVTGSGNSIVVYQN